MVVERNVKVSDGWKIFLDKSLVQYIVSNAPTDVIRVVYFGAWVIGLEG